MEVSGDKACSYVWTPSIFIFPLHQTCSGTSHSVQWYVPSLGNRRHPALKNTSGPVGVQVRGTLYMSGSGCDPVAGACEVGNEPSRVSRRREISSVACGQLVKGCDHGVSMLGYSFLALNDTSYSNHADLLVKEHIHTVYSHTQLHLF